MVAHDLDTVADEFLGDAPRAAQWRAMRAALSDRLRGLRTARQEEAQADPGSERLRGMDTQIAALSRQVAALGTEAVVAEFVENSLHVTLARAAADRDTDFDM